MNQQQKILKHLKTVGSLTGVQAADLYRIRELPARICELRRHGYDIVSEFKRDALGQRYARYTIAKAS